MAAGKVGPILAGPLAPLTRIPWPWLGMFLGQQPDGKFSFAFGLMVAWLASFLIVAGSVGFAIWGAKRGLVGGGDRLAPAPAQSRGGGGRPRSGCPSPPRGCWVRRGP